MKKTVEEGRDSKNIPDNELLFKKKQFYKNHELTNFLEKRSNESIPFVFPVALTHKKTYKSSSQRNRYERVTQLLLNLKIRIQNDPQRESIYVREVMHLIYSVFQKK